MSRELDVMIVSKALEQYPTLCRRVVRLLMSEERIQTTSAKRQKRYRDAKKNTSVTGAVTPTVTGSVTPPLPSSPLSVSPSHTLPLPALSTPPVSLPLREATAPSAHQEFIAWFTVEFTRITGSKPTWNGKTTKHVKDLLTSHGPSELRLRAERMFASAGTWPAEVPTMDVLRGHFDRFVTVTVTGRAQQDIRVGAVRAESQVHTQNGKVAL